MRNKEFMDVCIDRVSMQMISYNTFHVDLRFISFDIIIKNIEISLGINPSIDGSTVEFINIEFPYSWNPDVCWTFYALEFGSEIKMHLIKYIRAWVENQPILMTFLKKGFNEYAEATLNNLPE